MFKDRFDAGKQLAKQLLHFKNRDGVVIAVPRGGIELGYEVAKALDLPLEVVLTKKLGHPYHEEYAIGAISLEGRVLHRAKGISDEYIEEETERVREILRKRQQKYYGTHKPEILTDRIVIIVDDGIATGSTLLSSIELIRQGKPSHIVVAVPVASPKAAQAVKEKADEFVCLLLPQDFYAVGQFYESFYQVTDDEVAELLEKIRSRKQKKASSQ